MLLEAKTKSSVRQCEEEIVVWIESVAVTRKAACEEFQLVIGRSGGHDGAVVEFRLDEGGNRGNIIVRTTDDDVEIGIYHQFAIHGQRVQQPFYVFLGDAVGRVGHGAVTLRLAL